MKIERLISRPVSADGSFPVALGRLKRFASVPWSIPFYHSAASRKVMPILAAELNDLNPDRTWAKKRFPGANPFFHHCSFLQYYIAWQNGKPAGRIAAFVDRSYREPSVAGVIGWIGLFECVDDSSVAGVLLDAAIDDLRKQGVVKIIGPARFNANGEDGILVDGFDKHPMVMEPYQPPYYDRLLNSRGIKENDWYAFRMSHTGASDYMERIERMRRRGVDLAKRLESEGITIRTARLGDWKNEVARIKAIYNAAWNTVDHPQFEPFTDEEFDYLASGMRMIAIEDLVFIVEDTVRPDSPVIGMAVALPDLNEVIDDYDRLHRRYRPSRHTYGLSDIVRDIGIMRLLRKRVRTKKFKNARIFILGTLRKKTGLDALLYLKLYLATRDMGVEVASGSQIADTNPEMVNPLARMGEAELTWRIYRFDVTGNGRALQN